MRKTTPITRFRFWLWLIALVGVIVPRRLRANWRQEWEAELRAREAMLAEWDRLDWRNKLDLLWRSTSAFWDALWLQPQRWEDEMIQDLRFGLRMLAKQKLFTVTAVLCLSLGLGANTAIFSLTRAVLWRPLPVPHAERLALVTRGDGMGGNTFSHPDFLAVRASNDVLEDLAVCQLVELSFGNGTRSEALVGELVSGNYFATLGVAPTLGRDFSPEEDRLPGAHPVVIVSHAFWQTRLDADPNVIGRGIILNNHRFTVIGVAPAAFAGMNSPSTASLWLPTMMWTQAHPNWTMRLDDRRVEMFRAIGRLKPNVTLPQAQAALELINQQLDEPQRAEANARRGRPADEDRSLQLSRAQGIVEFLRPIAEKGTALLSAVTAILLLLACANVANLLLARATSRRKEIAVRSALGAGRVRIMRQLLTESLLLAGLGAAVGLLFAYWLNQLLMAFQPPLPAAWDFQLPLRLDWAAFGFALLLALLATLLVGLAPAWQASKPDLVQTLKDDTGTGARHHRFSLQHTLVIAQVAISLVLLVGAGLFLRSLWHTQQLRPGFETKNRLTFYVDLGTQGYDDARKRSFIAQVSERLSALPGVRHVAAANFLPLSERALVAPITVEGRAAPPGAPPRFVTTHAVSERYFETLGTPLLRGRAFTSRDTVQAPLVAVISERMARDFWPNEEALGKRVRIGPAEAPLCEIVGIAQDTLHALNEEPRATIYRPLAQHPSDWLIVALHTMDAPQPLTAGVRRAVLALDANLPLQEVKPLDEVISFHFWPARMCAALLGAFGLLGLLLAAVGIYGVMSYVVTERTREIGLRMALGATPRVVLRLVVRQGLWLTLLGTGVGLLLALAATRWLASLLYGVSVRDPLTFIGVPLLLGAVAHLACYVPARRATKVDPMIALRHD